MPATAPHPASSGVYSQPFRWTRERYESAIEAGIFTGDDDIELLEGEIVEKMAENTPHEITTGLVSDALREAFGSGTHTRDEKGIALSGASVPQPDVAVVRGSRRDYLGGRPTPADILLLVEVSDSSLLQDRYRKPHLYAEAGIAEYWIVNLRARVVEVYRQPEGGEYPKPVAFAADQTVSPVHAPEASIAVADLLP